MIDTDYIYSYSRADALRDGVLLDVTEYAHRAGFVYPVAVTSAVYHQYLVPNEALKTLGQTYEARLWDLLLLLRLVIHQKKPESSELLFQVAFRMESYRTDIVPLKSVVDGGDDGNPVITIMLEGED